MHRFSPASPARFGRPLAAATTLGVVALALAACTPSAPAEPETDPVTLQFAHYLGPNSPQSQSVERWAQEIEELTNGQVTIEFNYSGSLLQATDVLPGVAQGRADLGWTGHIYHPSELVLSAMSEILFTTQDPGVQMRAYDELYSEDGILKEEYDQNGVHAVLWPFIGEAIIGAKAPLHTTADVAGMSIRSTGNVAKALSAIGGNPVALAAPEIYEGIERGTIDAYSSISLDIIDSFGLPEVGADITVPGTGLYTQAVVIMTESVWDSFSDEVKAAFATAAADYYDYAVDDFLTPAEDAVCDVIEKNDGSVTVWSDSEVSKFRAAVGDSFAAEWKKAASAKWPAADVDAQLDEYESLIAKYAADSDYQSGAVRCADRLG